MLPDNSDDEEASENPTAQLKSKNKLVQQIEDAKKWAKLQALSKNFLERRDFLEAIE